MIPAPVSLEQARLAHELGIALRKSDGKYGFKLPCPVCTKPVADQCFCAKTIELAIKAVRERKSPWVCSPTCYWKWDSWWDMIQDVVAEVFRLPDGDSSEKFLDLQQELVKFLGGRWKPEIYAFSGFRGRWLKRLRERRPALYRRAIEFYDGTVDPSDAEPWEDDEGEIENCGCEI